MNTEDKPDLKQELFDYISKTFVTPPLNDEISGLVSIFEKHGWSKKVWQKEKPDYPCLFVARTDSPFGVYSQIWTVKSIDGSLQLTDNLGMKDGNYEDLTADEYFVIEKL